MFVQIRPADALLSPEPGDDQGTLFMNNVVRGYTTVCYSVFFVLYLLYFFWLDTSPPRGAIGSVTFR